MSKVIRLFSFLALVLGAGIFCAEPVFAGSVEEIRTTKSSLSKDIFEQNIYYEGTEYLRLDRLYRKVFRKKVRAKDVNSFDEVPNDLFFTNRHSRERLNADALKAGYRENNGPDASGNFAIIKGHFGEFNNRVWARDSRGDLYLVKFDQPDALELSTGAEMIAGRILYAAGYNFPQKDIVVLNPEQLIPAEDSKVYDGTGFNKRLTPESLAQFLLFLPQTDNGQYRVVTSKAISGESRGAGRFHGNRRDDVADVYDRENRRSIRALRVFFSWINSIDVRPDNMLDVIQEENGQKVLKHFLVDQDSALGSDAHGFKLGNFGYEYILDYGETGKAVLGLGLWEKPWQKRWRENGEAAQNAVVGYFDNKHFNPEKYKIQLPNYAFKDMTRADAFWAAKIIMSFTGEDIATIVKSAQYTNAEDADAVTQILTERRDIIGRYWFSQACPIDNIDVTGGKLVFEDLAVKYQFEKAEGTVYNVEVYSKNGKKWKKASALAVTEPSIALDASSQSALLRIRVSRAGSAKLSPYADVELSGGQIVRIAHQD